MDLKLCTLVNNIQNNIKNNFNIECITDQYVELYKDVLLKSKNCDFIK